MHNSRITGIALLIYAAAFLSQAQTFGVVAEFDYSDGSTPAAPHGSSLVQGPDGNFYGTTSSGGSTCGTVFQLTPSGTLTTLHNFDFSIDGCSPESGLILASDGNLYGATGFTIFKITLGGTFTLLYTQGSGGPHLINGLIQATDGNFYGTSSQGGTGNAGTIFRITSAGMLTVLFNLSGGAALGSAPQGPLVQASDGNLYGTMSGGGAGSEGTVFRMTLAGTATTIHSFCVKSGCPDGANPSSGLLQANDGNLYGTTASGYGTIFKITLGGTLSTLYSFVLKSSLVLTGTHLRAASFKEKTETSTGRQVAKAPSIRRARCSDSPQGGR